MSETEGFWRDRRVLVTGCTGLVGAWTTRALLERGAHVVGIVRDQVHGSELVRGGLDRRIDVVRGCVEDERLMERSLAEYEIQTVFHLAAQTIVGIANKSPLSTFETNIKGTWCLLEAARRCGRAGPRRRRLFRQGLRRADGAAVHRRHAAGGPPPLRRQQVLRGHPLSHISPYLPPAGLRDALRQLLRRRRPELEPPHPRHDPLGAARRTAADPLRRQLHPRLLLRQGRGGRLPAPRRAHGPRPGNPRPRLQFFDGNADERAGDDAPHPPADGFAAGAARPERGVQRDQEPIPLRGEGEADAAAGRRRTAWTTPCAETVAWYRAFLAPEHETPPVPSRRPRELGTEIRYEAEDHSDRRPLDHRQGSRVRPRRDQARLEQQLGRLHSALREVVRRLRRHALCADHVELHWGAAPVAARPRRRSRRRGDRAGDQLGGHRQRREILRRRAGLRRYRRGYMVHGRGPRPRGGHGEDQGDRAGSHLRPPDRHDEGDGPGEGTRPEGDGGRGAGAGRRGAAAGRSAAWATWPASASRAPRS